MASLLNKGKNGNAVNKQSALPCGDGGAGDRAGHTLLAVEEEVDGAAVGRVEEVALAEEWAEGLPEGDCRQVPEGCSRSLRQDGGNQQDEEDGEPTSEAKPWPWGITRSARHGHLAGLMIKPISHIHWLASLPPSR